MEFLKMVANGLKGPILIFGVLFIFIGVSDMRYAVKEPKDINVVSLSDIAKGDVIESDITFNYGAYEEEYSTNYGVKESGSEKWSYVISAGAGEDWGYMGLKLSVKDYGEMMDKQAVDTYAYMNEETDNLPETLHIKGVVCKMSNEDLKYYEEFFGGSDEYAYAIPYYISDRNFDNYMQFIMVGIIVLIISIIIIVIMFKVNKAERQSELEYAARRREQDQAQGGIISGTNVSYEELDRLNGNYSNGNYENSNYSNDSYLNNNYVNDDNSNDGFSNPTNNDNEGF